MTQDLIQCKKSRTSVPKASLLVLFLFIQFCSPAQNKSNSSQELQLFTENVFHLSEVMLHDAANPPAASRFYAYSLLGAYEIAWLSKTGLPDLNQKIKGDLEIVPTPFPKNFNLAFSSIYAMLEVGSQIMPSGSMLDEHKQKLIRTFRKKLSAREIEDHVKYGTDVARQVVAFARTDNYNKLSTYPRYTPNKAEGHWYPTPPEYMAAIEPQWKTVRPFFLDSASQFSPLPAAPFSTDTTSSFYRQMMEVYHVTKNATKENEDMANFWDCNPFAVTYSGHMAIGLKKISPGGHWMSIAGIACRKANIPLDSAILIHTIVATTLHDAFIGCWQEKYSSDRIRPESAINKLVDPDWRPLLQTPPFPEYTSGHSVVSASAATVLTYLLGDNFSFTDTSEEYFGLPARNFNSFNEAAAEAAISRLYGGIHFRDACEQGIIQGKKVGQHVINSLYRNSGSR